MEIGAAIWHKAGRRCWSTDDPDHNREGTAIMATFTTTSRLIALAIAGALVSGCATKDFGRMEMTPLAGLSCEQLAAEQKRVDDFRAVIDDKDDFDARSAAGLWLDFGFGNMRDKKKALKSANEREASVTAARQAQGCA